MNELIKINYESDRPTVLARDLHEFLEVKTAYKDWFPRMCEYGFAEGEDYCSFLSDRSDGLPGKPRQDAQLTIDMAKEICMLQRNEKGKQARQYFLQLERKWNSPEAVMSRALRMAEERLERFKAINANLSVQNAIMQPKAEYFDGLCDRESLTGVRETAKLLGMKQNDFVKWLIDHKYIYRDKRGRLMPYAEHVDSGLFTVKETYNDKAKYDSDIAAMKLDSAIDAAITAAKGKNARAIKALITPGSVKLDKDGKLEGFDDQLKAIRESDAYLFDKVETRQRGGDPDHGGGDPEPGEAPENYADYVNWRKNQ